ncbi:alpha/beta fold hydrolase [Tenggerimyces flavus]|uniref:Alpha/beta fold hydrolase n=1 Tax=Tenggerimyces flavus TaxID=1708749 RepID=A0ABV7YKV0_9ACTN|nr:alpha/beta hydrolase [Tenggerimyces flavus]MBM7789919.1 pimeloyl-ACP methyl ester carboxylesterase [Tenggerimyces flavus]
MSALAFSIHGPAAGRPMVLLHGLTSDRSSWDSVLPLLSSWRSYVPDLRGHGASERAERYSFELLAADILALLDEQGLARPVLVGHSMGGVAAYLLAARHPTRLSALVLEETPPPFPQQRPVPERPPGPLPYDWTARVDLLAEVNNPGATWLDELGSITVPTLVLGGGPTSPFPQDQMRLVAERIPRGEFVSIPVGHGIHKEDPDAFVHLVRTFLAGSPHRFE